MNAAKAVCFALLPVQKIIEQSDRFNRQGYKVVEVSEENMSKCIGCAFCAAVCPDCVITVYRSKKPAKG